MEESKEDNEIDVLNIPAYKRKRSIAAKARKKTKIKTTKKARKKTTKAKKTEIFTDIPITSTLPEETIFENRLNVPGRRPKTREMKICGRCEGYFEKIDVVIVEVTSPIRTDDVLIYETTDGLFEEKIKSMQIDRRDVSLARSGNSIGVKVTMEPKVGGLVYKVLES
ncbi:hypothetical protein ACFL21_02940 [Patescibacteria group bacterium]